MALWSVYYSTTFSEALEKCVNMLGDADSTGSMVGQLAGAIYGYSGTTPSISDSLSRLVRSYRQAPHQKHGTVG